MVKMVKNILFFHHILHCRSARAWSGDRPHDSTILKLPPVDWLARHPAWTRRSPARRRRQTDRSVDSSHTLTSTHLTQSK